MMKHVSLVMRQEKALINPSYISHQLKSIAKHFVPGQQEDAHEFLRHVIDHMWRALLACYENESNIPGLNSKLDSLTKATTAINHIFGGYLRSQVLCLQCKATSNTYDYFMDMALEIHLNVGLKFFFPLKIKLIFCFILFLGGNQSSGCT